LSRQCFGILPKVAEVDRFMTPERQKILLRECHPELVFQRLNGRVALAGKKTADGRTARIALLGRQGFAELPAWLAKLPRQLAAPDDLLDACACALAARDAVAGRETKLDCRDEVDARGLRMEMWY
jgi:predicted RNase H-like nuclease